VSEPFVEEPVPDDEREEGFFHVSPAANRESIREFGLDWTRMGAAPGIATGRYEPEEAGIYLARGDFDCDFFIGLCNHDELLDVWEVRAEDLPLFLSDSGFVVSRAPISPDRLRLVRCDVDPASTRRT
jgi:hypothetical protein